MAKTTTLNVSLPEKMKQFVAAEVARQTYGSASEYIRDLIRKAHKDRAEEILEAKLREGDQGQGREMTEADWQRLHDEIDRRAAARRKT